MRGSNRHLILSAKNYSFRFNVVIFIPLAIHLEVRIGERESFSFHAALRDHVLDPRHHIKIYDVNRECELLFSFERRRNEQKNCFPNSQMVIKRNVSMNHKMRASVIK